jgi:hypothetical protein
MRARLIALAAGVVAFAVVAGLTHMPLSSPGGFMPSALLVRANPAVADARTQIQPVTQTSVKLVPSPKPTPQPARTSYLPHTDCTKVLLKSLTAQPAGLRAVNVSWSVSGSCYPHRGEIGASYFDAGGYQHWMHYIQGESGTYTDSVPPLPGVASSYCSVTVIYMLIFGGTDKNLQTTVNNVRIC